MISGCPNPGQETCRWQYRDTGCFADTDHIVPQRLGSSALSKTYIQLAKNKQQLCRHEHDRKTRGGDEPLPPIETMRGAVVEAQGRGEIFLGRNAMKAVYGRDWRQYQQAARELNQQLT